MVEVDFEIVQPRGRRVWRVVKWPATLLGLTVLWFGGVTWTWGTQYCEDCGHDADVLEYRVLGIAIDSKRVEYPTSLEFLMRDLGRPCQHENVVEGLWHRWWGLAVCAFPCWNGTIRLIGDNSDYESIHQPLIFEYADDHPEAADELWGIIKRKDRHALRTFYERVSSASSQDEE